MTTRPESTYEFDRTMSRETLTAYLSRAVTFNGATGSPNWDDDLRMIHETGALFLGRAAYVWVMPDDDERQFELSTEFARRVHDVDPRIIVQACVFESIYPEIDAIRVPQWVFEEFDESPKERTFSFSATHDRERREHYPWQFGTGGTCPDIARRETQRWFYYRARRYIDAGYEAIHLGQPHMYCDRDPGYVQFAELCSRIRAYAREHARRHLVLLDAHTHGIVVDGELVFDWHSRPLSATNRLPHPEQIILQLKGRSLGGRSPQGWECETNPYLYEVDNWGGYSLEPTRWCDPDARESVRRWGWDDIAWFAHQPREERHRFLRYAALWCRVEDDDLFFQPVLRRLLGEAGIAADDAGAPPVRATHGAGDERGESPPAIWHYRANRTSEAARDGFGDEEIVAEVLAQEDPPWLADYHARVRLYGATTTPETPGVRRDRPGPVILVGEIQELFGGRVGDNYDPFSRLYQTGEWIHERALVIPVAGRWEFVVGIGGTGVDYHRQDGRSRGPDYAVQTSGRITIARFRYDVSRHELTVIDQDGASLLERCTN